MGTTSSPDIDFKKPIEPDKKTLNKTLDKDLKCPIIGLGTILIKERADIDVVYQSIKDGVRLIDTEPAYEELVGEGIKKALDEKIVRRKDLFIVTKLELEEKDDPEKALRKSLDRLDLKYVDLYLDHWPSCINVNEPDKYKLIPVKETWQKMEKLVNLGITKSIGLCNYNVENLFNILSICEIKPVVNEVEFHPYLYQKDLKEFCDKEGIVIFAYNPMANGELYEEGYKYQVHLDILREAPLMKLYNEYHEKNKITKDQIILNWHMCVGVVPLPEISKPDKMKENLQATRFTMNNKDIETFNSFEERKHRFCDGSKIFGTDIFA